VNPMTECPGCRAPIELAAERCPYCGHLNPIAAIAAQERWLPAWTQGIAEGGFANGSFDIVDYPAMPLSQALQIVKTLPIPPKVKDVGNYAWPALGFDERSVARADDGRYFLWPEDRYCSQEEAIGIVMQIYGHPQ
jgi:hypothetical protein